MSGNSNNKDDIYFLLKDMKEDIRALDHKVTESIKNSAAKDSELKHMREDVNHLQKVLIDGNGSPSVLSQIHELRRDISETKIRLEKSYKEEKEDKPHKDKEESIQLERVKLGAKVAAFLAVLVTEAGSLYQIIKNLMS